ncbi:MAG: arsenate reductase ArsC [Candidatus Marinimicrobia bacterium]|nr:arsenate reductase ArsC [Candidatus Neomarinimicrobiota bacterium]
MIVHKPKVLFVCTGNSCRSQIAEGLLIDKAGDIFDVFSAGTYPSHVHPAAMKVMEEWGIDISHHTSDPINKYLKSGIDVVITVCDHANNICPTFPGNVERLHWSIEDPFSGWDFSNESLDTFRETRATINKRIDEFLISRKNE